MGKRWWGRVERRGKSRGPLVEVCNLRVLVMRERVKSGVHLREGEKGGRDEGR